ncbi:peptidyl-tRNA hydrolase [Parabacteroides faecis]|jgi:peptidyl-tRNA hydrolase|nr:peptidyl-tRNA hydrolase [Parabacteroides faecis]
MFFPFLYYINNARIMKYLITGLGNIGSEYWGTRHNIGFRVVNALAEEAGVPFTEERYGAVARMRVKNCELILLKPNTFMNLSGNAVRYWLQKENIPVENLLVVVDDLALPFGTLRLKPKGSDAGHNGLKNIQQLLGTQEYNRLRFGIGSDFPRGGQIDYVLGKFPSEELELMPEKLKRAIEIVKSFCLAGVQITMNQYNNK